MHRSTPSTTFHICRANAEIVLTHEFHLHIAEWQAEYLKARPLGKQLQLQAAAPDNHCQQGHKKVELELVVCLNW